jgi:hypothetical protein
MEVEGVYNLLEVVLDDGGGIKYNLCGYVDIGIW